ncbi:hypothetical protein SAMN05216559_2363 [Halomicrobium zhouii]|uniref:CARDB protein n=1 Tax=Halomicrobium zhouii TaxID=767519 RepID=A0A1I6LAF6_9EURY|nr:hypothetical protein [Halomicrobium zhouii]SFS00462.1 hypothetical protein SAMN05216559_2363 [Halomicrobium zhouii]
MDGGDRTGGSSDEGETSTTQKVVMAVSILFTLSLVAYGAAQMAATPSGVAPSATVVGTDTMPNDEVAVSVRLRNPGDVGLVSVTVEADCARPPPSVQLTYVPASTRRQATLVCPAGTTDPNVSVANWVMA